MQELLGSSCGSEYVSPLPKITLFILSGMAKSDLF